MHSASLPLSWLKILLISFRGLHARDVREGRQYLLLLSLCERASLGHFATDACSTR